MMTEPKQKRKDLSLQEKQKIIECYDKLPKMSQRNAAMHLRISQPLLCKILKNRTNIQISLLSNENMDRKRERSGKDGQVESALKIWFSNACDKNTLVNGSIIRQKAEELAKTMGKDFIATDGWFNRWKKRENIVYKHFHTKEKSVTSLTAYEWLKAEWLENIAEYAPQDIYNANETGIYFHALPEHTYMFKNKTTKVSEFSKERVTVLCCVNMIGEKRNLLVIGKNKTPQCFRGVKSLPVNYFYSSNAWMTNVIFNNWLIEWDNELKRKIILLVSKCSAHINNLSLKNIKIIFLPLNITSLIQPCDLGIIQTLKAYYHKHVYVKIINEPNNIQDQSNANIIAKKISLLDALHFLAMSWKQVSENIIKNCFLKSQFSKIKIETLSSEEINLITEATIKIPSIMSKNKFGDWVDIDSNIEGVTEITISDICHEVINDNCRLLKNNGSNELKEKNNEAPPTDIQMQEALQILRRGIQYRTTNFDKHYDYENYIQEIINTNK